MAHYPREPEVRTGNVFNLVATMIIATMVGKACLFVEGGSARILIAVVAGVANFGAGIALFRDIWKSTRAQQLKWSVGTFLIVFSGLSAFCTGIAAMGDYAGPMNETRRIFLQVFNIHAIMTVFGGMGLGLLGLILLATKFPDPPPNN